MGLLNRQYEGREIKKYIYIYFNIEKLGSTLTIVTIFAQFKSFLA